MTPLYPLVVGVVHMVHLTAGTLQHQHEQKLLDHLFTGYNKDIRPRSDHETTGFGIYFFPMHLIELNEKFEELYLSSKFVLFWKDPRLKWNSTEFGGIKELFKSQSDIWRPKIRFMNSVSEGTSFGSVDNQARILSSSRVQWEVDTNLKLVCEIDVKFYPFDEQTCSVEMAFGMVSQDYVLAGDPLAGDPARRGISINTATFTGNGKWQFVGSRCYNRTTPRFNRQNIIFHLVLRRRTTFYHLNIVLPVVFLSMTSSAVFLLPAESGEKMGVSITVLLAFSVYLSIIADELPETSTNVCFLQIYLTSVLGVTALAVLCTGLVLKIHHTPAVLAMGARSRWVVTCLTRVLCVNVKGVAYVVDDEDVRRETEDLANGNVKTVHGETMVHCPERRNISPAEDSDVMSTTGSDSMTWMMAALALDRLFFIVFSFIVVAGTVIMFPYLYLGGPTADLPEQESCEII